MQKNRKIAVGQGDFSTRSYCKISVVWHYPSIAVLQFVAVVNAAQVLDQGPS